jgi:hypothetical protein
MRDILLREVADHAERLSLIHSLSYQIFQEKHPDDFYKGELLASVETNGLGHIFLMDIQFMDWKSRIKEALEELFRRAKMKSITATQRKMAGLREKV